MKGPRHKPYIQDYFGALCICDDEGKTCSNYKKELNETCTKENNDPVNKKYKEYEEDTEIRIIYFKYNFKENDFVIPDAISVFW